MKRFNIIATYQEVFSREELDKYRPENEEVIGPDTLLYWYQEARERKDYDKADYITKIGEDMSLKPVFTGNRYEVHEIKKQIFKGLGGLWSGFQEIGE